MHMQQRLPRKIIKFFFCLAQHILSLPKLIIYICKYNRYILSSVLQCKIYFPNIYKEVLLYDWSGSLMFSHFAFPYYFVWRYPPLPQSPPLPTTVGNEGGEIKARPPLAETRISLKLDGVVTSLYNLCSAYVLIQSSGCI